MSFADYKKSRTDLTKINKKVEEITEGNRKSYKDSRFWRPTVDKAGNGSAKIRFLSAIEGEDLPWVQYHEHNFDLNGSYYIELCPTTLGRECPACKANSILWKTEIKENQAIVSKRKRKLCYVSNILVLKDSEEPENEGKVFLYQYGQKIFEKIKGALKPQDAEDAPVNVFDFWDGADFTLAIKQVAGYRNYDDSKFRTTSPLFKGDESEMKRVFEQLHKLQPFIAETKFKSYEELEKKFDDVVSGVRSKIQKKADELFPEKEIAKADVKEPVSVASEVKPKADKTRKTKEEKEGTAPWEEAVKKPSSKGKAKGKKTDKDPEVKVEDDASLNYYDKMANDE